MKQFVKKLSVAAVIPIAKKVPEKTAKFFKMRFYTQNKMTYGFFLFLKMLDKNQ
jgi:hypothetical protein